MGNAAKLRRERPLITPKSRVSAIVINQPHGAPLIGTQVPVQASVENDDYSCSAITGHIVDDSLETSLRQALAQTFWRGLDCLPYDAVQLNKRALPSRGKQYWWYLVWLQPGAWFDPNPAQIQRLDWNCQQMLPHQVRLMRPGRREMFLHCLQLAVAKDERLEEFRTVLSA